MKLCVLLIVFAGVAAASLEVQSWAGEQSHYGYECQLFLKIIGENIPSHPELHLTALNGTVLNTSGRTVSINGSSGNWYTATDCTATDSDICLSTATIPADAGIVSAYNTTHQYLVLQLNGVYCPLSEFTPAYVAISIIQPQATSSSPTAFNETIQLAIANLSFRDLISIDMDRQFYEAGCFTKLTITLLLVGPEVSSSWYELDLGLGSPLDIEQTLCSMPCVLQDNTLLVFNREYKSTVKNFTEWSSAERKQYFTSPTNIQVELYIKSADSQNVTYNISLWSKFIGDNKQPLITSTYNGIKSGLLQFIESANYYSVARLPPNCQQVFISTVATKGYVNVIYVAILLFFCLLVIILRKIPYCCEEWVYALFVLPEFPILIACYASEAAPMEKQMVGFIFFSTLTLHLISWLTQTVSTLLCCRSPYDQYQSGWKKYYWLALGLLNSRFVYFQIKDNPPSKKQTCLFLMHGCQLLLAMVIGFTGVSMIVDGYLMLNDRLNIQMAMVIYSTIYMPFTSLFAKVCLSRYLSATRTDQNSMPDGRSSMHPGSHMPQLIATSTTMRHYGPRYELPSPSPYCTSRYPKAVL